MRTTNLKTVVVISLFLLGMVSTATGKVIFVDHDAAGTNDGSSWTDAYTEFQSALDMATSSDQIWVAQGTYRPDYDVDTGTNTGDQTTTFQLTNGVALYGGFPTGGRIWEDRAPNTYETILSGDINVPGNNSDNSYHVVTGSGTNSTAILDGFTVTAGYAIPHPRNIVALECITSLAARQLPTAHSAVTQHSPLAAGCTTPPATRCWLTAHL